MENQKNIVLHRRFLIFYKKNTLALFFSFVLSFMLITTILVLIHTNHRIENIESKTMFTPSDCLISELSWQQIEQLKKESLISHLALQQITYSEGCNKNGKSFYLQSGDDAYITLMAKVKEGRLPKTSDEIVAEKWVLLNLGVLPELNQKFQFEDGNGKTRTVKVSGILSDMRGNVQYGVLNLYTAMEQTTDMSYTAYITFRDGKNCDTLIDSLCQELKVNKKQVKKCPAREDFSELRRIDIQIICVILFVCLVVFYGIYKIVLVAREKQYGILRALGMERWQFQGMILLELYQVYFIGTPVGIATGLLIAWFVAKISGDADTVVYLYNKNITYSLVIPVWQIVLCVIVMAIFTGLAGYLTGRGIIKKPVVETIAGVAQEKRNNLHFYGINNRAGKIQTLFSLSCNYILKNIKLSAFVIITICTGVTLFVGLAYKAETLQIYREDTKELWYLNGHYEMSMRWFNDPYHGVSRQNANKILKLKGVNDIKTSAGIRVRVIDEDGVKRNDEYYEQINANVKKYNGYELRGHDGTDQIYKTALLGYNANALKELEKYVVSGRFDAENIKENEIILAILSTDNTKQNDISGWYRDGKKLMEYEVGDKITMKYRADFNTDNNKYEKLEDSGKYIYKTYTVAAIVSFEYMYDCNRSDVYPQLITSDEQMQKIVPDGCYQCIYIDTDKDISETEQSELERKLISIGAESGDISTRSLAGNIEQNEMFYHKQMVYIYGIAIIVFVLVLINMTNNLRHRMYSRTREICMLRAVGMSVSMAREIFVFENTILSIVSVIVSYFLSHPVLYYLYKISDMKVFGHKFAYNYAAFLIISAATVILCMVLSANILKLWKTKHIIEAMGKVE